MTYSSEANIARQIADLCVWISEGHSAPIDMDMSLTRDLGFDSMKLMQFFAGIEELYAGIALEDWFIAHSSNGRDTIGSVVRHVAGAVHLAAAE
jgi:acyl carrier protein